ncbi:MAG: preprotein translocase subunit SecE [Myxococcales bacterium]|jgi:preprotein translocase subunit SecE|nr:preprotein translocase subunit SecE [Myxococcales bacterium]
MDSSSSSTGLNAGVDVKKMVGIAYVALGIVSVLFFSSLIESIFAAMRWSNPTLLGVEQFSPATLIGFGISLAIVLGCFFNKKIHAGSVDIATELKRVTWPSFAETKVSTVAVVVVSIVASLILFFFDFVSSKIMSNWIPALLNWISGG